MLVSLVGASLRSLLWCLGPVGVLPVAVSRDGEHDAAVQEPVQHGSGGGGVGEDVEAARKTWVSGVAVVGVVVMLGGFLWLHSCRSW